MECLQIKETGSNFWGEPIRRKVWIICSLLLYLNFKTFKDPNSSSFIRLQCVLLEWVITFSNFWNFCQLKKGDLIYWGNQFYRKCELFGPPFCVSILKVLKSRILRHSIDFNAFCMIQEFVSHTLKFLKIKEEVPYLWGKQILQKVRIIWYLHSVFQF